MTAQLLPAGLTGSLLAQGWAGADPLGWWDVLRHDVIPVASAYLVVLGLLAAYRRATRSSPTGLPARPPVARPTHPGRGALVSGPKWGDLVGFLLGTVAGGYVFFLAIVVVFYFVLGSEDESFIRQALVEGSLLAFVLVIPAFLLLSWLEEVLSSRGRTTQGSGPP